MCLLKENATEKEVQDDLTKVHERNIKTVSVKDEIKHGRSQSGGIPVKVAAVAEPFEEVGDDSDSITTGESDSLEQGVDVLISSEIDDLPPHTIELSCESQFV